MSDCGAVRVGMGDGQFECCLRRVAKTLPGVLQGTKS